MTIIGNQIAVTLDAILLATDFSPSAETAKIYAQALAEDDEEKHDRRNHRRPINRRRDL